MFEHEHWMFPPMQISLPEWVGKALPPPSHRYKTAEEKMMLVVRLSSLNIENGTGGPFGAAVFDIKSQKLIAPGVNLVQGLCWSGAHAEMVAIAIAQRMLRKLDLGSTNDDQYELYSSTEPCAMCMGCVTWSGVRRLACGARDEDARAIGFDEGIKAKDWPEEFRLRGIEVLRDICRDEAAGVLQTYKNNSGLIYNGRMSMPMC